MSDIDRIAFVTVGSTRFDTLVARVLSHEVLEALIEQGFTRLVVQVGSSHVSLPAGLKMDKDAFQGVLNDLDVTMWRYKPALNEEYERAQLVIGHAGRSNQRHSGYVTHAYTAGSGTILEVLRLGCRMIAVPNETLLHNHQSELAEALESRGFLLSSSVA